VTTDPYQAEIDEITSGVAKQSALDWLYPVTIGCEQWEFYNVAQGWCLPPQLCSYALHSNLVDRVFDITTPISAADQRFAVHIVSCQSEIFFVLSSILCGRRFVEVWDRLHQLSMLPQLAAIFDDAFPPGDTQQPRPARPAAESSEHHNHDPKTLRKIEYLRLLHEFWDARDMSDCRRNDCHLDVKRILRDKLCSRLIAGGEDACTENLLCYALEAYLRGYPLPRRANEQFAVAERILRPLILSIPELPESRLESVCGLIAELVKEPRTLHYFQQILESTGRTLELLTVMRQHPFHGNLLLRSVLLSLHSHVKNPRSLLEQFEVEAEDSPKLKTDMAWESYSSFLGRVHAVRTSAEELPLEYYPPADILSKFSQLGSEEGPSAKSVLGIWEEDQGAGGEHQSSSPYRVHPSVATSQLAAAFLQQEAMIASALMSEVTLTSIENGESLCCITSGLAFCLVAHCENRLPEFLQSVAQAGKSLPAGKPPPLKNFLTLLCLWISHYSNKQRYEETLYYCTHVPSRVWRRAIGALLSNIPKYT
jgi:hypothetical protein